MSSCNLGRLSSGHQARPFGRPGKLLVRTGTGTCPCDCVEVRPLQVTPSYHYTSFEWRVNGDLNSNFLQLRKTGPYSDFLQQIMYT